MSSFVKLNLCSLQSVQNNVCSESYLKSRQVEITFKNPFACTNLDSIISRNLIDVHRKIQQKDGLQPIWEEYLSLSSETDKA